SDVEGRRNGVAAVRATGDLKGVGSGLEAQLQVRAGKLDAAAAQWAHVHVGGDFERIETASEAGHAAHGAVPGTRVATEHVDARQGQPRGHEVARKPSFRCDAERAQNGAR